MKTITSFLWFDSRAEEAVDFYLSIFPNGRRGTVTRSNGKVLVVRFELQSQEFIGLNGGPLFPFTEAVSFVVSYETQAEVDTLWEKLSEGGTKSRCGWLKDRFGHSWQIVPTALPELMSDPDPAKANSVLQAMMGMDRILVEELRRAHEAG